MSPLARLKGLPADERGATAIITGLLSIVAMGFVALGVDMGAAYNARRSAQNVADAAAFSAAVAQMGGATNVAEQARAVAASYGLPHGVGGVTIAVNTPPLTGPRAADNRAVEVIVTRPGRRFFSSVLSSAATTIQARAVAITGRAGNGCVIAFNPTASMAAVNNGTGTVNLAGCQLYVNSTHGWGFTNNGAAAFNADTINVGGPGYLKNGTGTVTATNGVKINQPAIADPYADVAQPQPSGACEAKSNYITSQTFDPGPDGTMRFCSGLTLSGVGQKWTFNPGVYFIENSDFILNALNSSIIANDATFILTSSSGSNYANMVMNGNNNTLDMTARTSGPTAGILFFQDRRAPADGSQNTFNGNGTASRLRGAVYFRNQTVSINGIGQNTTGACTQILADKVVFNGASNLGVDCTGAGVRAIGGFATALVE